MGTTKLKKNKQLQKALNHLFSMKKRCENDIGVPVLRNTEGECDPLGACLPKSAKNLSVSELVKRYKKYLPPFKESVVIQLLHDNPDNWGKSGIRAKIKKRLLKMLSTAGYDMDFFGSNK